MWVVGVASLLASTVFCASAYWLADIPRTVRQPLQNFTRIFEKGVGAQYAAHVVTGVVEL